jgi:hypothetical protein
MKVIPAYDAAALRLTLEFIATGYDDALPLVGIVFFEGLPSEPEAPAIALASAVLLRKHCGSMLEVEGSRGPGLDILEAVRLIQGEPVTLSPLSPLDRQLSSRTIDVRVRGSSPGSRNDADSPVAGDTVPTADLLWTGDFVDASTRSSLGQVLGPVMTNAWLVAPAGEVSVAAALLLHGLSIRRLRIGDGAPIAASIPKALRLVAIDLIHSPA